MFRLTHKELLELTFWAGEKARDGYAAERAKLPLYMRALQLSAEMVGWCVRDDVNILEIGTGPYWGLLPYLTHTEWSPRRRVAVDPLIDAFDACGLLEDRGSIQYYSVPFEQWDADSEQFDAIISTNALDHGEMGFYLLPKIARLLKPGGKFFCHVHLRPPELLNILHDHSLTMKQYESAAIDAGLTGSYGIWERDIDGQFCPALVGIWRKP